MDKEINKLDKTETIIFKIINCLRKANNYFYSKSKSALKEHFLSAINWINNNSIHNAGVNYSNKIKTPYPEVTGYFIPTLLKFGEIDRAIGYARWLVSMQNKDGSWSDPDGKWPYTFDSGQILKGLFSILNRLPEIEPSIIKGSNWLLGQIMSDGRVTTPNKDLWRLPNKKMISENIHLYALEPLRLAAHYFNDSKYAKGVDRALNYYLSNLDLTKFNTLSHFHGYILEAFIDLGYPDVAAKGMLEVEALQNRDGSIPAYPDVKWICSTGVAQYAVIWYKLGQIKLASKAFNYLCNIQNNSGGFYGSYGFRANYSPREEISWAVKYFLDALYWHIRTAFDNEVNDVNKYPDDVEENDKELETLLRFLGDISGLRVLDAGCGKGRFAKRLISKFPEADIWGVDISDKMLCHVSDIVKTRQGSLLNLPFPDNYFDYVYCIEALEHAVNHKLAVRELCRVIKPGGRILIIDKNSQCNGIYKIEAWEKWFYKKEVESWLNIYCKNVNADFINHGIRSLPNNMLIAWQGGK